MVETTPPHQLPDSLPAIAAQNNAAIVDAIAREFHLPIEQLRVLSDHSFANDDGTVSFIVEGTESTYGVSGTISPEGTLTNITTLNLQATEYAEKMSQQ